MRIDKLNYLSSQEKLLLKLIQEHGPLTRSKLIQLTKMKLTTLNRAMQPLINDRLIKETEVGESTGGRKPQLYDINPERYYIIGVDISRTYTRIVITDLKMNIIKQELINKCVSPDLTVKLIAKSINTMRGNSIERSSVLGLGIGTVGPLDRDNGIMTTPQNFPADGWVNVPIKEMMERETGLPVLMDNGANTAVIAEHLLGNGKGADNIAYFNCGVGIRTGAIVSGTIVRSMNNAEDVFAHMVIDVDGEPCTCGNYGCIECYSSIHSITKKFISELKKGRISTIQKPVEVIDYTDICKLAEDNDALARGVIENAAVIFGAGLANYINLMNPQYVILSGPLIKHSRLFYDISTQTALKRIYPGSENKVTFCKGGYFEDTAMAVGAAVMVLKDAINTAL